jgi:hypothetical protein
MQHDGIDNSTTVHAGIMSAQAAQHATPNACIWLRDKTHPPRPQRPREGRTFPCHVECSICHGISAWDTETRTRQDSSRRKQVPHELSLTRCKPGLIKVCTTHQKTQHAHSSEPSKGQEATPVAKTHTRNRHRRHSHHDENGVMSCPAARRWQGWCPSLVCGSSLLRRVCP